MRPNPSKNKTQSGAKPNPSFERHKRFLAPASQFVENLVLETTRRQEIGMQELGFVDLFTLCGGSSQKQALIIMIDHCDEGVTARLVILSHQ